MTPVTYNDSMPRPLALHPDRLFPADPGVRAVARSLYAHVRDKGEIDDLMITELCSRVTLPAPEPGRGHPDCAGHTGRISPVIAMTACDGGM